MTGARVATPTTNHPGVARLDALDRLVQTHASEEAAQLARDGWDLATIRETISGGLSEYLTARIRDAVSAGVCAWETDTSGRLSALEQRLAGIEREAAVRETESRQSLGDLRRGRGRS